MQAGDTLDFVTDCVQTVTSDSFEWTVNLRMTDDKGNELDRWDSAAHFHGPLVSSVPEQIARAWRLAYCRPATADEMELACQFVEQQIRTLKANKAPGDYELISMSSLCQQILTSATNYLSYLD